MTARTLTAFALSTTLCIVAPIAPANAAKFDGNWSLTAVTTKGHCGKIYVSMNVNAGQIQSSFGLFALFPIQLGGRISDSGRASISAIAGPRTAKGTGKFNRASGSGKWKGRGPSGLCSGYWRANRN